MITDNELLQKLCQACKKAGSQRKWALENELSPQYVNDVLNGSRKLSDKIGKALGYEKPKSWENKPK